MANPAVTLGRIRAGVFGILDKLITLKGIAGMVVRKKKATLSPVDKKGRSAQAQGQALRHTSSARTFRSLPENLASFLRGRSTQSLRLCVMDPQFSQAPGRYFFGGGCSGT